MESKIVLLEEAVAVREQLAAKGNRLVFTNGCFDILHAGHVHYLETARAEGDFLLVGLNSDRSVRRIKGERRPIFPETMRAAVLAGLACVDLVVLFDEDTPARLIEAVRPDVLVKGGDWAEAQIVGAQSVKQAGGRVVRIPFAHDISTSMVIGRILATYRDEAEKPSCDDPLRGTERGP